MIRYENDMNPALCNVKPSGIRKFFSIAEEMDNVISLGVGEPDFLTPWHIRREGIDSLDRGATRYTANAGLLTLRQEICAFYARRYHLQYRAENQVLVTVGGSEGIDMAIRTLVCPGDEVLVVEPSFVCYKPLVEVSGGVAVPLVTKEEDNFRLTAAALEAAITPKTKLLVFPYPNNPTGAVMRREDLEPICRVLQKHKIYVLSDEIYNSLTYGPDRHVCFAELDGMKERTIVVDGFSKSYAMTGWRLGYVSAPEEYILAMNKIHQHNVTCAPSFVQKASIAALRDETDEVEKMVVEYQRRRDYAVKAINEIPGLSCRCPKGAFYIFINIKDLGISSAKFADYLLDEAYIALVPGDVFGTSGEGYIRMSFANSYDNIVEGVERMAKAVEKLRTEK